MKTIQYINLPASLGKSYKAVDHIIEELTKHPSDSCLFVVPTTELAKETKKKFTDAFKRIGTLAIPVHSINKDSPYNNMQESVLQAVEECMGTDTQKIIIITQETFKNLATSRVSKINYHAFLDESFDVISSDTIKGKVSTGILSTYFTQSSHNTLEIIPAQKINLKLAAIEQADDTVLEKEELVKLFKSYTSDIHKCITEIFKDEDGNITSIKFITLLLPCITDGYKSVNILSAYFELSPMHQIWKSLEVNFTLNETLKKKFKSTEHTNGHLLHIYYLQDQHKWITNKFNQSLQENAFKEIVEKWKSQGINESDMLYRYLGAKHDLGNITCLPGKPHGINTLYDKHYVAYLTTHMPNKDIQSWLNDELCLSPSKIRDAFYHLEAYQSIMRCALRDQDNVEPIHIVVGDKGMADFLNTCFGGKATVQHMKVKCVEEKLANLVKEEPLEGVQRSFNSRLTKKLSKKYSQFQRHKIQDFIYDKTRELLSEEGYLSSQWRLKSKSLRKLIEAHFKDLADKNLLLG